MPILLLLETNICHADALLCYMASPLVNCTKLELCIPPLCGAKQHHLFHRLLGLGLVLVWVRLWLRFSSGQLTRETAALACTMKTRLHLPLHFLSLQLQHFYSKVVAIGHYSTVLEDVFKQQRTPYHAIHRSKWAHLYTPIYAVPVISSNEWLVWCCTCRV